MACLLSRCRSRPPQEPARLDLPANLTGRTFSGEPHIYRLTLERDHALIGRVEQKGGSRIAERHVALFGSGSCIIIALYVLLFGSTSRGED